MAMGDRAFSQHGVESQGPVPMDVSAVGTLHTLRCPLPIPASEKMALLVVGLARTESARKRLDSIFHGSR